MKALTKSLFLTLILIPGMVSAKKTDGQFDAKVDAKVITLTSKKGFHFNDKAPAYAIFDNTELKNKPIEKTEPKFIFKTLPNSKKVKLSFYVCDDAKTVCEMQGLELSLPSTSSSVVETPQAAVTSTPVSGTIQKIEAPKYSKTTVLIFSAPWCPACIRLHSETVSTNSFQAAIQKTGFKKINVDLVENEKISEIYGVKAIPTTILVNKNGEEIKRWLDYQPPTTLVPELQAALKNLNSVDEKIKLADNGDIPTSVELGYNEFAKMNWADAAKRLAVSQNPKDMNYKLAAEVNHAQDVMGDDEASKENYTQTLEKASMLTTSIVDSLRWKVEYIDQRKDLKKSGDAAFAKKVMASLQVLQDDPKLADLFKESTLGDVENFEQIEAIDLEIRLAQALPENKDLVSKAQEKMFDLLNKIKLSDKTPGQMISAIYYYGQANHPEKSEELLKQLTKKFSKSYVYYQKYASFLVKQKKHEEALTQINLALKFKEGNEPQLNLAKIKILKELGQTKEALALIESTKKLAEPYPTKYKRTMAQLNDLKINLEKPQAATK